MKCEEAESALAGILSGTAALRSVGDGGCISGEFGLDKGELARCCITGIGPERQKTAMELVLRCSEAGERVLVLDMRGSYLGLVGYIPSLRVYRVGRNFQTNPFSAYRRGFPELVAAAVQAVMGASRIERAYLERALQVALSQGKDSPRTSDILEALLQVEAESHPRQGMSIDSLRNALWGLKEFDRQIPPKEVRAPALIDLSKPFSPRASRLAAIDIFLNLGTCDPTVVVIDPADVIFPKEAPEELLEALELSADELAKKGSPLIMATSTASCLPRWVAETLSSEIRCSTLACQRERARDQGRSINGCRKPPCKRGHEEWLPNASRAALGKGNPVIVFSRYSESAHTARIRKTEFKPVSDEEIEMHMKTLGDSFEEHKEICTRATLLRRIFVDKTMYKTAKGLMVLIRGGRVPVDAVAKQRSGALKRIVRTLSKYFLIVEFSDGSGTNWYKLTKAGERALEEEDVYEGEVCV